jgi:hypothetical protein
VKAAAFYKAVTMDRSNFLNEILSLIEGNHIRYCVIGGQAVNAYAEPLVSLDLDIVVASSDLVHLESLLSADCRVERLPHGLTVVRSGSDLRVHFQTDPRYFGFLDRSSVREVLGRRLRVAAVEDVLKGQIWAALDAGRRPSRRQKDLADVARLLEAFPDLRATVPPEILSRLYPGG